VWQISAVLVPSVSPPSTPSPSPAPIPTVKSLVTLFSSAPSGASAFVTAVKASPAIQSALLSPAFRGTVLLPSDAAFTQLLSALGVTLNQLLANSMLLASVLRYHVIPTTIYRDAAALAAAGTVDTLQIGKKLAISGSWVAAALLMLAMCSAPLHGLPTAARCSLPCQLLLASTAPLHAPR
jgi:hypothetical protein